MSMRAIIICSSRWSGIQPYKVPVSIARVGLYRGQGQLLSALPLLLQKQEVHLQGRPSIGYDVLSLDVGITPSAQGVPGALEHATPVKPVHK